MENPKQLSDSALKAWLSGNEMIIGLDGRNIQFPISVLQEFLGIQGPSGIGGVVPDEAFVPGQGSAQNPAIYFAGPGTYAGFGGIELEDPLNVISWNGSVAVAKGVPIEVPPAENKIPDFVPGQMYFGGSNADQRFHDQQIWQVDPALSTTTQEPGTGNDWIPKIDLNKAVDAISYRIPTSRNRYDKTRNKVGFTLEVGTGNIIPVSGRKISDYIPVEFGKTYRVSGVQGEVRSVYGFENIGDTEPVQQFPTTTITPNENVNFVIVGVKVLADSPDSSDTIQFEEGTVVTPYVPYTYKSVIKPENLPPVEIPATVLEDTDLVSGVVSNQQFNKALPVSAGYALGSTGRLAASSSNTSLVTRPIPLNGAEYFAVSGLMPGVNHRIAFWKDVSGGADSIVGFTPNFQEADRVEPVPEGALYGLVWFRNGSTTVEQQTVQQSLDNLFIHFSDKPKEKDAYKTGLLKIRGVNVLNERDISSSTPGGISEIPKRIDERYISDFALKQMVQDSQRFNNTINSLRKIKQNDSGEKTFNISNPTGIEQRDVTLILNLHHGSQVGTPTPFDLFMDGSCRTDFTDIRFLDEDNNLLEIYKESAGNYEIIADATPLRNMALLADNSLIGNDSATSGVYRSLDSAHTWVQVKPAGVALGGNLDSDIFYSVGNNVFKSTKSSGYTDEVLVLADPMPGEAITWRAKSFRMDDVGNLYMGQYQTPFAAIVWKSTNGGNSFFKGLDSPKQHVHSINIDRNVVPNIIYVNCDGEGEGPERMATVKSVDRGITWEEMDFGFDTDSGVLYVGDGYTLGGGEAAIKSQPTIFKRTSDGKVSIELDVMQNSFNMQKLGDAVFVSTTAHTTNRYAKIYRKEGENGKWETIFSTSQFMEENTAAGWRYGLFDTMPENGDNESQLMFTGGMPEMVNLRIFEGGEHYQGLFYVKVPVLPADGMTLKVGYGYLAEDVEGDIFQELTFPESLAVNLPLNEYGQYVYDNSGNQYQLNNEANWIGIGKRYGWLVPEKKPYQTAAVQFSGSSFVTIENDGQLDFNKGFTVNVWMRLNDWIPAKQFLFGRVAAGSELFFVRETNSRIGIQYGDNYQFVRTFFSKDMLRQFVMVSLVLTNDETPELKLFLNGTLFNLPTSEFPTGELILSGFINGMAFNDWVIGGNNGRLKGVEFGDSAYYTDFSLFNRVLSSEEIRVIYEGTNLLRP